MSNKFSIHSVPNWADNINYLLSKNNPEYIARYGEVNSEKWWEFYHNDEFVSKIKRGRVSFIGIDDDPFGESQEMIQIDYINDESDGSREFLLSDHGYFFVSKDIKIGTVIEMETLYMNIKTLSGDIYFLFNIRIEVIS